MFKDSENSPAPAQKRGALAVLFLSPPPANGNPVDWYWRKIAGLPFLLRNILNIQRGGIGRLVLFMGDAPETANELLRRLNQDPRVTLQLVCPSDAHQLMDVVNGAGDLIFLEGSALHDKARIKFAVEQKPDSANNGRWRSFFIDLNSMTSLLESADSFNFFRLERARERFLDAMSSRNHDDGKKTRVYFLGGDNPRISNEMDFDTEGERVIKASGGLADDSFATRILSRPVSNLLTRLLLNTRFTPNHVTLLSFVLGLVSAWSFFQGGYELGLMGAGGLIVSVWLDGVDGEIARIKFMDSTFGAKLDIYCDNIVHIAVFFSIGMGLFHARGEMTYLYLGGLAAFGSLICFLMLGSAIAEGKSQANFTLQENRDANAFIERLANRDFAYLLFALALFDRLDAFLWLTAIGVNFLALYLLFTRKKSNLVKTGG